jgi:hypothetical protein
VIVTSHSHLRRVIYTYTYTYTYYNNNAVLEELLRKLACCRYDLSSKELEEHLSSYQVSNVLKRTAGLPGRREY